METEIVKSVKINLGKKILVCWIVVLALLAGTVTFAVVCWNRYKEAQDVVISLTLAANSSFSKYKDDRSKLVEELYDFYNPSFSSYSALSKALGIDINAEKREAQRAAEKADNSLGESLKKMGYDVDYSSGSVYLRYSSFPNYLKSAFGYSFGLLPLKVAGKMVRIKLFSMIVAGLTVVILYISLWYNVNRKSELRIEGNSLICSKRKKTMQFMMKDVTSVNTTGMKGIKIQGENIKFKIILLDNVEDLKNAIMERVSNSKKAEVPAPAVAESGADTLKKYKELLDTGVITQEEFDAKKAGILNS